MPLVVVSTAWACGVLATLKLDKKVAAPGDAITATGKNWGTAAGVSDVTLRLKKRSGQVLATTPALTGGRINETFALPTSLRPGWYVVLATQFNANGTPKTGTPGRTTLRVQGTARKRRGEVVAAPWSSSAPPAGPSAQLAGDGGSNSLLPILLGGGLSLTMLAGGWALLSRKGPRAGEPQFSV
ncbi:MAG: hypothetical protein ACRDLS_09735 [Solirubrobacteraceae bacterium]